MSRLWQALGLEPDGRDVEELAIERIGQMQRLMLAQCRRGRLWRVVLYPCPKCSTWNVDEWHEPCIPGLPNKHMHATECASVKDAMALYRAVLIELKTSIYDPQTDSYSCMSDGCNFIVTGSHGRCSKCAKK